MNKNITFVLIGALLTACANAPQKGSSSGQVITKPNSVNSVISSQNTLKDLDEPGVGVPRSGGGVELRKNRIATFYPEPSISEKKEIFSNCTNAANLNLGNDQSQPIVDQANFNLVMSLGSDAYKKRKVWEANLTKNAEAEKAVRNGRGYTSFKSQQQSYQKDQSTVTDRSGRMDTRKLSNNILKSFGLDNDPRSRALKDKAAAYEELFQNIAFNNKVLASQDTDITNQEKAYIEKLSQLYFTTLDKFTSTPPEQITSVTLNSFSKFRQNNIYQCIFDRVGATTPWPQALIDEYNGNQSAYVTAAQSIISIQSPQIIHKLNAAKSSDELKSIYYQMFETKDLRDLVEHNPKIAEAFSARSARLVADEKKRYEAYLKQQAEEAKRKEKARLAEFQKKIKNNLAPSAEDILPLAISASMNMTSEKGGFIVEKTGNNSYAMYANFFGNKIYRGSYSIEISNVKCTPTGKEQLCSYTETSSWVNVELFGAIVMPSNVQSLSNNATFKWSQAGLLSDNLTSKGIITVTVGGSGSNYTDDSDARQRRYDFEAESNNRHQYNMQKQQNNGYGSPYDSSKQY